MFPSAKAVESAISFFRDTEGKAAENIVGDGLLWRELEGIHVGLGPASAAQLIESHKEQLPNQELLDYGCGAREYRNYFLDSGFEWVGVDLADSQDPKSKSVANVKDSDVIFYDGMQLPFSDNRFGSVFSNQVFEHVHYPDIVVAEISRVLAPGGILFGSVSQTEPYHSLSTFNWTAFGTKLLLERNGLRVVALMAGADMVSLTMRYVAYLFGAELAQRKLDEEMFTLNKCPLWERVQNIGRSAGKTDREIAVCCLGVSGHIQFVAVKNPSL